MYLISDFGGAPKLCVKIDAFDNWRKHIKNH